MTRSLNPATLRRLRKRFDLVPEVMKAAAKRVIDDTADQMVAEMRRAIDHRSGKLAESIRAEDLGVAHAVRVRVKVGGPLTQRKVRAGVRDRHAAAGEGLYDYAMAIEYGHLTPANSTGKKHFSSQRMVPPEPFFRPTRDRNVKRLRFRLRAAIKKALASMGSQNPG